MRNNRWLQGRLKDLKKTQSGLARLIGEAPARITEIINGTRQVAAAEISAIAAYLEMPESIVFERFTGHRLALSALKLKMEGYVGAGEEVVPIETDEPVEWIEAPPGVRDGSAVAVRGESMAPAYQPGDILVLGERGDPAELVGRDCVVRLATGHAYVKRLSRGSRKGRYHLLSHNKPDVLSDSRVQWAAPILWVKKA